MAIHMDKDPGQGNDNNNREGGNSGGGGLGGLMKFLPIVAIFLFKNPRLTIPVLAILAAVYFFTGGEMFGLLGGGDSDQVVNNSAYELGGVLDEKVYDKAKVYEPLMAGSKNQLPSKVSLSEYAPRRLNQGRQGSCVGWSSAYAARTIAQARATGQNPNEVAFSPSFLYNQIALEGCQGAYIFEAMKNMQQVGSLDFDNFPYNEGSCGKNPNRNELTEARDYRITGYERLSMDHDRYKVNMLAVKQNLAQGAPVVIGMMVGGTFMNQMRGKDVWMPSSSDYRMRGFGGHAMCVTGYDDNKAGGAFEIMNSWGETWGDKGYCWVRYADFEKFVREAYGLHPMGKANEEKPTKFELDFGLVKTKDGQPESYVQLNKVAGASNVFRSARKMKTGDRFKVEVTNNLECYIYIFNEEANGTSNVLFPYTSKHSAYCGITGTRIFPRDYSMVPDDVGNRDRIAIVITKVEMQYESIKAAINNSQKSTFADRVDEALGTFLDQSVRFTDGETVSFEGSISEDKAVAMIIEVEK